MTNLVLRDMWNDMDDFMSRAFLSPRFAMPTAMQDWFKPHMDVVETETAYEMTVDLPGVKKDDVKIDLHSNTLTVSGEKHREEKTAKDGYARFERAFGKFERTVVLPETVSADKIEAKYDNGVLKITLPKAEVAKPRTITVQ